MANDIFAALRQDQARQEQARENAARMATSYTVVRTIGTGQIIFDTPIELDSPFFQVPSVVTGVTLVRTPDPEYYQVPRVTSGVFRWQRNERGWYIGAWMYFAVDTPDTLLRQNQLRTHEHELRIASDEQDYHDALRNYYDALQAPTSRPIIDHHIQFTGNSYKQLGDALIQDVGRAEALLPPLVGAVPEDIDEDEED